MKVKFHNEEYPNDLEFDFGGVILINGKTVKFEDEELDAYEARHGRKLKDVLLANQYATVDGIKGEVTYLVPETPEPGAAIPIEPDVEEEGDN